MDSDNICPYYGKNDDFCDVGCGYISPFDVNMIIRYCSGRQTECIKFQELEEKSKSGKISLADCRNLNQRG